MACHAGDVEVGVRGQNAQRFTAGIARGTGHGHCIFRHTHLFSLMCLRMSIRAYADYCIFMQWVCWYVNATYAEMESEEEPVPPVSCWRASW